MDISIIVPCYNSARTLRACLGTLDENTKSLKPGSYEVIAPVRQSTDETCVILLEHGIKPIEHTLVGISSAYNLGVSRAQGKFVVFLNSDDELGPNFLGELVAIVNSEKLDNVVVYSSILFIDINGDPLYWRHPAPYIGLLHKYCSVIMHPNAIYPLALLRKHPFEVLEGAPPRDREQVYELMKEAVSIRTRTVHYRYRIWGSSGTVMRANKRAKNRSVFEGLASAIARIYVQLYETDKIKRVLGMRFGVNSLWRRPI